MIGAAEKCPAPIRNEEIYFLLQVGLSGAAACGGTDLQMCA